MMYVHPHHGLGSSGGGHSFPYHPRLEGYTPLLVGPPTTSTSLPHRNSSVSRGVSPLTSPSNFKSQQQRVTPLASPSASSSIPAPAPGSPVSLQGGDVSRAPTTSVPSGPVTKSNTTTTTSLPQQGSQSGRTSSSSSSS
ncbi:hypothetical protein CSUI_007265, partial [Cystoisospora suis]